MKSVPDVIFIIDTNREHIAVLEAKKLGIPIIGIIDTNRDPDIIDYPIPANDDGVKSVQFILDNFKKVLITNDEVLYLMKVKAKMSSMELIKKLRDTTGSGIVDCKKALAENNNDIEAAIKWLREKGILKAQKTK